MDKLYFYLLDQANGDYNTIAHPQSDSSIVIGDKDREREQLGVLTAALLSFSLVFVSCYGTTRFEGWTYVVGQSCCQVKEDS